MISLKPVQFLAIQHWFVDYQKKSKNYEMPPEQAELMGVYRGDTLIGYFITLGYNFQDLVILQGYLRPEDRHKNISKIAMTLLEQRIKEVGYKKIILQTYRAVSSYQQFMRKLGFNLHTATFSKELL